MSVMDTCGLGSRFLQYMQVTQRWPLDRLVTTRRRKFHFGTSVPLKKKRLGCVDRGPFESLPVDIISLSYSSTSKPCPCAAGIQCEVPVDATMNVLRYSSKIWFFRNASIERRTFCGLWRASLALRNRPPLCRTWDDRRPAMTAHAVRIAWAWGYRRDSWMHRKDCCWEQQKNCCVRLGETGSCRLVTPVWRETSSDANRTTT